MRQLFNGIPQVVKFALSARTKAVYDRLKRMFNDSSLEGKNDIESMNYIQSVLGTDSKAWKMFDDFAIQFQLQTEGACQDFTIKFIADNLFENCEDCNHTTMKSFLWDAARRTVKLEVWNALLDSF